MRIIPTFYKGYKFRSRLEAKWAVFFDAIGIEWDYEIEGFVLPDQTCYLPDFFLPSFNGGMWVEVKPIKLTDIEREKCYQLCLGTKFGVWMAVGTPAYRVYDVFYWDVLNDRVLEGDGIPNADQAIGQDRMLAMSAYGKAGKKINPEYWHLLGDGFTNAVKRQNEPDLNRR